MKDEREKEIRQAQRSEMEDFYRAHGGIPPSSDSSDDLTDPVQKVAHFRQRLLEGSGMSEREVLLEQERRRRWNKGRRQPQTFGPMAGGSNMEEGPSKERNRAKKEKKLRREREKAQLGEEEDRRRQLHRREFADQVNAGRVALDLLATRHRRWEQEEHRDRARGSGWQRQHP